MKNYIRVAFLGLAFVHSTWAVCQVSTYIYCGRCVSGAGNTECFDNPLKVPMTGVTSVTCSGGGSCTSSCTLKRLTVQGHCDAVNVTYTGTICCGASCSSSNVVPTQVLLGQAKEAEKPRNSGGDPALEADSGQAEPKPVKK
jgi:hypothetical protein